jgi:hypothetical protein
MGEASSSSIGIKTSLAALGGRKASVSVWLKAETIFWGVYIPIGKEYVQLLDPLAVQRESIDAMPRLNKVLALCIQACKYGLPSYKK